jgi:hypothetical protein
MRDSGTISSLNIVRESCKSNLFIRQIAASPESIIIGEPHKYGNIFDVMMGEVILLREDGTSVLAKAGFTSWVEPGDKRIAISKLGFIARNIHSIPKNWGTDPEVVIKKILWDTGI